MCTLLGACALKLVLLGIGGGGGSAVGAGCAQGGVRRREVQSGRTVRPGCTLLCGVYDAIVTVQSGVR